MPSRDVRVPPSPSTALRRTLTALGMGLLLTFAPVVRNASAQEVVSVPGLPGQSAITAYWFPAPDTAQAAPAVVGVHGCSGALDSKGRLSTRWKEYARWFNRENMHFLVVDSFTPRGKTSICEIHRSQRQGIDEFARRADVYAAVQWLSGRHEVDASRLAVAGWSHGAQTVLRVVDRSDPFVAAQTPKLRAAVAYYPGCTMLNTEPRYALATPLLLMTGALDDWTPPAPCQKLAERIDALPTHRSARIDLVVYPDSYHGFDGTAPVRARGGVANTRSGTATVGGNPQAREASRIRLFEFLSTTLDWPLRTTHTERFKQ